METLLILGAGIYQLPLITTAKRMGLKTVVVTPPGHYPGIQEADLWCDADTRDAKAVLKIAKEEHISGICTSGTDVAVKSLGYVCDQLGLSGISYDAACKATDKMLMKEAFWAYGVSTAAFRIVHSAEEALEAANAIGYPVMVKITDSSGSRGITKVCAPEGIASAYADSAQATRNDYVIVEKFIEGVEIGVDGFVDEKGNPAIILPHGKFVYKTDAAAVPLGHYFPLGYDDEKTAAIHQEITKAAKALGLTSCAFNADVLVNNDGVHIIEMGGRTGATCIPELISIHKGYDWYEKLIDAALGKGADFASDAAVPCMAKLLASTVTAQVEAVDQQALQSLQSDKVKVSLDVKPGDTVERMVNGTNRFGQVIAQECTEEQLDQIVQSVKSCLTLAS